MVNKIEPMDGTNLTSDFPWWWDQLAPEVQKLVSSENFSYFCSLVSSGDENMLNDMIFVLDCCMYSVPETKALVLYHMLRISEKIVVSIIRHSINKEMRDEFFNLTIINGNLRIASTCLSFKNFDVSRLTILDTRYKNRIDELTDFLELLLQKSLVNLKWIKQQMMVELSNINIDLAQSKFSVRLFVYLCDHFEIPYSPESILLQNRRYSYK